MRPPKPADPRRSALMAKVRQRGTAAELAVAAVLRAAGHAYRLNVRALPGSPDFANRTKKWAVFVHGCFWHRHPGCVRTTTPKTNTAFWEAKFEANRRRDAAAVRALRAAGFTVVIVWECETENATALRAKLQRSLKRVA